MDFKQTLKGIDYKHLFKTIWSVIVLDTKIIENAHKEIKKTEIVWMVIAFSGVTTFLGQYFVTRGYSFAPSWWWFFYYALSVVVMIVALILCTYFLAKQYIQKIDFNTFFVPAGLGSAVAWITLLPGLSIVGIWYVVVLFQVVKTMFKCTTEKAALVVVGGVVGSYIINSLFTMIFQGPSLHWYI